jgi:hypothetical protein
MTCHIAAEIKHVLDTRVFINLGLACLLTDLLSVCKCYISPTLRLCKFVGFFNFLWFLIVLFTGLLV